MIRPALLFALLALVAFAIPLVHFSQTLGHDWDYFNALSWLVRTNVVGYHELNVYDPWGCGGLDVWANPQHRMLSPLGLLDLTLPPHIANLTGLILHAFAGLVGAFLFFRHFAIAPAVAATLAFVFIDGSWFALHFAAGHIPYGGIQLLPWAGLFAFHFDKPKTQLATALFFAFLLLDGALYALIFSAYLMLTLWLVYGIRPKLHPRMVALAVFVAATACVKAIPILAATGRAPVRSDASQMGPLLLLRSFFDPRQYSGEEYLFEHLRFHEFGCYLGLPLLVVLIVGRHHLKPFAVALLVWLWAASAWLTPFNPWQLHRLIPFVNTAHVQSRVLIIVFLLLLIAAGLTLTQIKQRRWILALLVVESIAVRTYTFERTYREHRKAPLSMTPIAKTTLHHTLLTSEKPGQYEVADAQVHNCYEPSLPHAGRIAVASSMADYRGEAWVFGPEVGPSLSPGGSAEIVSYVPARIVVSYAAAAAAIVVLNTRHNGGWSADNATVISKPGELLAIRTKQAQALTTLRYQPAYRPYQIAAALLALIALIVSVRLARSSPTRV